MTLKERTAAPDDPAQLNIMVEREQKSWLTVHVAELKAAGHTDASASSVVRDLIENYRRTVGAPAKVQDLE